MHDGASLRVYGGAPESGKESGKSLPLAPSAIDERWAAYPRKVGKETARPVFERLISSGKVSPDELLAGARRYAAERVGQGPKYTKHPKTWLNGGHWADEPAARPTVGAARPSERDARPMSATDYLRERQARRMAHD